MFYFNFFLMCFCILQCPSVYLEVCLPLLPLSSFVSCLLTLITWCVLSVHAPFLLVWLSVNTVLFSLCRLFVEWSCVSQCLTTLLDIWIYLPSGLMLSTFGFCLCLDIYLPPTHVSLVSVLVTVCIWVHISVYSASALSLPLWHQMAKKKIKNSYSFKHIKHTNKM